jgi:hypothetical protein
MKMKRSKRKGKKRRRAVHSDKNINQLIKSKMKVFSFNKKNDHLSIKGNDVA